ncbi:Adenosine monophosphate-protein transferase FICD [Colletotrichum tanaceti]|uniref:Adenosine monophosphate-protein transferase FICD n=1 Tax=Colletotrichum tanaceti TaxID=1306861 RepID=A0A4U6XHD0_9PEZI|nr:Adenosine monophosphate-protein transferase FICD [Colletotrichum tanaceti]KAJ0162838.1 Adenosine monophosphate-protein transferase FICD [Colletotrichum tanaceti]TKW53457.1 Adenosine monophosphate-protein transferase FICD [Colletotrichum tanaceti]
MSGDALVKMQRQARRALLVKIYEPASRLRKGSPAYNKLACSGRVWEDFFQPGNSREKGYLGLQRVHRRLLADIDALRVTLPVSALGRRMVPEYAQQSVMIENNPLTVGDAHRVLETLREGVFRRVDLASMSSSELVEMVTSETAGQGGSALNELTNHIIASQWIAESAASKARTAGFGEAEVRDLAVVSVRNTDSEAVYGMRRGQDHQTAGGNLVWKRPVPPGEYRSLPIAVRSNRLRIFPYPQEVPACVGRFFEWRDAQHCEKRLHPLVLACQMTAYFVHLHPFPDGNGRTSRMIEQDYLARQGYLPAVIQGLNRKDYLRMIDNACEGEPGEFVTAVLEAQLAALHRLYTRCLLTDAM